MSYSDTSSNGNDRPDLVNKNLTVDDIKNRAYDTSSDNIVVEDSIIKNIKNMKATETDMLFQYFGNEEKYVNDVKLFEKPERVDSTTSDKIEDYIDKTENLEKFDRSDKLQRSQISEHYNSRNNSRNTESEYVGPPVKSEEDEMLEKLDMLRKLGELTRHGVRLSQNYSMKSDYKAMKYEYELHRSIRDKHNGVNWLSNMMINICYGAELANEKFDPFGFKLKGWSDQMNNDIDEYYDVFGELYEKYFKAGQPVPPEIKLLFMISGSAIKFHLAQAMVGDVPDMSDLMQSNPALAERLRQQAIQNNNQYNQNNQQNQQNNQNDNRRENLHQHATQKATDLAMLRKQEEEYFKMQQSGHPFVKSNSINQNQNQNQNQIETEYMRKQRELQELEQQLQIMRSETRSMYSNQYNQYNQNNNNNNNYPFNQYNNNSKQPTMRMPITPASLLNSNSMQNKQRDNNSTDSQVQFNPNISNIIDNKLTKDTISNMSTLEHDELSGTPDSKASLPVKKRRGRPRKGNIRIET